MFLFLSLSGAYVRLIRRSPADFSRAERIEEPGSSIEGIVEHGLQRVAETGIRHELSLAELRYGGPEKIDAGHRVRLAG